MGEAKRRYREIARAPCLCGSGRTAGECCFDGKRWHRKPTKLPLAVGIGAPHGDCYLRAFNNCSDKISREHLISEAVLRVIAKTGLLASGLPWMKAGEQKIGLNTIVGKCLCTTHNSALSDLDTTAANFFRAFEQCDLHRSGKGLRFLFSGHDIERWLLKTLAGFAASKNLAHDGAKLPGTFHPQVSVAHMLGDINAWPPTAGLYFTQKLGSEFLRGDHFWMAPLSSQTAELAGMIVSIQGFQFTFLAVPPETNAAKGAVYRPLRINFDFPQVSNAIELSWEDRRNHEQIRATFAMTNAQRIAKGLPPAANEV